MTKEMIDLRLSKVILAELYNHVSNYGGDGSDYYESNGDRDYVGLVE